MKRCEAHKYYKRYAHTYTQEIEDRAADRRDTQRHRKRGDIKSRRIKRAKRDVNVEGRERREIK